MTVEKQRTSSKRQGRSVSSRSSKASSPSEAETALEYTEQVVRGADELPRSMQTIDDLPQTSVERLFRGVLDFSPDAVVVVDSHGRIALANAQTEALFGYARVELIGQPVERLVPARFHDAHRRHRGRYMVEPRTRSMGTALQLFGCRKDGTEFPVEVSLSPLLIEGESLVLSTIRDVTERKALEAALRESEQRTHRETASRLALLQTILDQIPVGVYLVRGRDARLVLANRAVTGIWGGHWPEGQPLEAFLADVGTRISAMSGQPLSGDELATLRALRTHAPALHQQEVVRHRDGTTLPVLVNAIPVDTEVGRQAVVADDRASAEVVSDDQSFALVVHEDVTALREAERLKDEFVAMAAHELRGPMGTLSVYGSMLRRAAQQPGPESADWGDWQAEALEGIQQMTRQLVSLTDDLLDVTKLQAGGFWMHVEPHDLAALVRRVVPRIQRTTEHHRLLLDGADDSAVVQIDVKRMEQVLTNLLSNAIKYSPSGGDITISLARRTVGDREVVDLVVRDSGIGIAVEDQPLIFGRFARGTNARAQQIEGTGLGLYLCHELVERQGGQIWFESTAGVGSTFYVRLPVLEG